MRGAPFYLQPIQLAEATPLRPYFERIFLLQLSMTEDSGLRAYLSALKYWEAGTWREFVQESLRPEDVVNVGDLDHPSFAIVFYGFLRSWGYWSEIRAVLDSTEGIGDFSDITRFRERVLEVLSWRVNFVSRESFARFERLRDMIIERAVAEVPGNVRYKVQSEIEDIFNQAFGLHMAGA